jgi:hypothetical protein
VTSQSEQAARIVRYKELARLADVDSLDVGRGMRALYRDEEGAGFYKTELADRGISLELRDRALDIRDGETGQLDVSEIRAIAALGSDS